MGIDNAVLHDRPGEFWNTFDFPTDASAKAICITDGVAHHATNGSYTVPTLPLPTS